MNICFITQKYPGKHNQSDYAFVKQLVDAIAALGHNCYVVCPYNFFHYRKFSPIRECYSVGNGNVMVLRPWYCSFSDKNTLLRKLRGISHQRAIEKAFEMIPVIPDAIYGHFWNSGYSGFKYSRKHNIPLFVASGESDIKQLFRFPKDLDEFSKYISGVICVSSKNRDESIKLGLTIKEKCEVFPNSVNETLFHRQDKRDCRKRLDIPQNDFVVTFVGWFNERKGSLRLAEALKRISGAKSIFIGKGDKEPNCDGILFKGAVPHDQVPLYLGAADCFVLPTQAEGCCNAVVEAMACGLPVISSNMPFNWDVLDNTNSIMIDPNNIDEIENAIRTLYEDPELRANLAAGALERARALTIDKRAEGIVKFISSKI